MKQTIIIHDLPPMLNGKDGLKRMHWAKYKAIRQKWTWLIREQNPQKHSGKVTITFTRHSTRMADPDNVAAGFKVIGDSLVKLGIISDDSFDIITEFRIRWEKSKTLKQQKTVIEIEDV